VKIEQEGREDAVTGIVTLNIKWDEEEEQKSRFFRQNPYQNLQKIAD